MKATEQISLPNVKENTVSASSLVEQRPSKNFTKKLKRYAKQLLKFPLMLKTRINLLTHGVQPIVNSWDERGMSIHRRYLEQFLQESSLDIKGHCLEFQEDSYTSRFGNQKVTKLDILNKEKDHSSSTIVADLTKPNDIPSNTFDCIICTYVLHIVPESEKMISELHRILKPGGVLLVAVPNITITYPKYNELWRFTAQGLHFVLARSFESQAVTVQTYGNCLVAAGELRGMRAFDFTQAQLRYNDPRYAVIVCARAVKQ